MRATCYPTYQCPKGRSIDTVCSGYNSSCVASGVSSYPYMCLGCPTGKGGYACEHNVVTVGTQPVQLTISSGDWVYLELDVDSLAAAANLVDNNKFTTYLELTRLGKGDPGKQSTRLRGKGSGSARPPADPNGFPLLQCCS